MPKAKHISAWHSSAAITIQGELFVWGGNYVNSLYPKRVGTDLYNDIEIGNGLTVLTDH